MTKMIINSGKPMPIMVDISYSRFAVNFPVVYQKMTGKTQYYPRIFPTRNILTGNLLRCIFVILESISLSSNSNPIHRLNKMLFRDVGPLTIT